MLMSGRPLPEPFEEFLDAELTATDFEPEALPSDDELQQLAESREYREGQPRAWEKKGLKLGVGTDNDITLGTNYIREMLILLYTDSRDLKITKLLLVTTGETRRPYISHLLWEMRKKVVTPEES